MTVKVPVDSARSVRDMLERGVSLPAHVVELVEFAENFIARPLPGLGLEVVAGEQREITLTDDSLEADSFALIRLNGRVFAPEEIEVIGAGEVALELVRTALLEDSACAGNVTEETVEYLASLIPDGALERHAVEAAMRDAIDDGELRPRIELEDDGFITFTGGPLVLGMGADLSNMPTGLTFSHEGKEGELITIELGSPAPRPMIIPDSFIETSDMMPRRRRETHVEAVKRWRHEWDKSTEPRPWGDAIAWASALKVAERFDEIEMTTVKPLAKALSGVHEISRLRDELDGKIVITFEEPRGSWPLFDLLVTVNTGRLGL